MRVHLIALDCSLAQAQVTIEDAKNTYRQFEIGEPRTVAAWLAGYYHEQEEQHDR